jgi:microcystin-dependent protein
MAPGSVQAAGGSLPHENRQPLVCVTFIIALQGIYPTPS